MNVTNSCNSPTPPTPAKFSRFKGKTFHLVFDGDSHADRWEGAQGGKELWKRHFEGKAANFAIASDRIENILWRLELGQMEGVDPRAVVLMAGASNLPKNSVEEISQGIQSLATEYQRRCPAAKMILMGIPPQGKTIADERRKKIADINRRTAAWCAKRRMSFLDLTPWMLLTDGALIEGLHSDDFHMLEPFYRIWFEILSPILDQALGKKWLENNRVVAEEDKRPPKATGDTEPQPEESDLPIEGDFNIVDSGIPSPLIDALKSALEMAKRFKGKLDPSVLEIKGFSGQKYRYLINTLVSNINNPRYLEIGCYFGSTFCAAVQGNAVTALAIDNWSGFNGPIKQFLYNLASVCSDKSKVSLLSEDFREIHYDHIGTFNVFFFDGPHGYKDHFAALPLAWNAMDDDFIYIVDDWNWDSVRNGTLDSLHSLKLEVIYQLEIRTSWDNHQPKKERGRYWHNGYFFAVLRKKATSS